MCVLSECGVEVIFLLNVDGKVDLVVVLCELGCCEINELYVEVGFKFNGLLLCEGLVDEIFVYLVFKVFGLG